MNVLIFLTILACNNIHAISNESKQFIELNKKEKQTSRQQPGLSNTAVNGIALACAFVAVTFLVEDASLRKMHLSNDKNNKNNNDALHSLVYLGFITTAGCVLADGMNWIERLWNGSPQETPTPKKSLSINKDN